MDAYSEGRVAYFDLLGWTQNPYEEGTLEHERWEDGWFAARDDSDEDFDYEDN